MDVTGDELAGVVDLFGGLTPDELGQALAELAYKRGEEYDADAFDDDIAEAIGTYHLIRLAAGVGVDPAETVSTADGAPADDGTALLVPGPVAFPELPDGAVDLPHILDIEERYVDRETVASTAVERFRTDVTEATEAGLEEWQAGLLEVSYELEAWTTVDLAEERSRLEPDENP